MTQTHNLKTDPKVFEQSLLGNKPWEIRFNDRDFQDGDIVYLEETSYSGQEMKEEGKPLEYTGRYIKGVIDYVLHGPSYGLEDGWCIFTHRIVQKHSVPNPDHYDPDHRDGE